MLKPDVVEAVKAGKFHIHAASTIEDALSLLTGMDAAEVEARVRARIQAFAEKRRDFAKAGEGNNKGV